LFAWRRLANEGALTATAAEEAVVPASAYKALADQIRQLQRLLGKKTMEAEILKEALEHATGSKKQMLRSLSLPALNHRDDTP
jgi:transposase